MSATESKNKEALEILLGTLEENPDLWETRKKTARLLYEDKKYLEAADILWGAPEIPATDVDVAFALQVISRVKPNRSIRLIYEVLRRNQSKPLKNMAVARALNNTGLYLEAARFYGAAIADDPKLFNLAFERQMLWMDDSKRLADEWRKSDQEAKMPLDVPSQDLSGGMIRPTGIHNEIDSIVDGVANPEPVQAPVSNGGPVATQPLILPGGSQPMQTAQAAAPPAMGGEGQAPVRSMVSAGNGTPSQTIGAVPSNQAAAQPVKAAGGPATRSLLVAGVAAPAEQAPQTAAPSGSGTRPLMVAGAPQAGGPATNKLLTPGGQTKTNMLIPGNSGGGAPSPQQPMGVDPYGAPQANAAPAGPAPSTPMLRRPPTMAGQQVVATQGMQPVQQQMQQPPMTTQAMYPGMQQPIQQMPMATQPIQQAQGMPMAGQAGYPAGQAVPTQPMYPNMVMPAQGMQAAQPGMTPIQPGMMSPVQGMPMATQPMMPGQLPTVGQQQPAQQQQPQQQGPKLNFR